MEGFFGEPKMVNPWHFCENPVEEVLQGTTDTNKAPIFLRESLTLQDQLLFKQSTDWQI